MVSEGFQCGGRASEVRKGGDGNQDTVGKAPWATTEKPKTAKSKEMQCIPDEHLFNIGLPSVINKQMARAGAVVGIPITADKLGFLRIRQTFSWVDGLPR